jgi:hypothetical protein
VEFRVAQEPELETLDIVVIFDGKYEVWVAKGEKDYVARCGGKTIVVKDWTKARSTSS